MNQFLKSLFDKKMIVLDPETGWQWDDMKIKEMQVTDNLVDLLVEKIHNLPKKTQEALKICSCIGNRFDLETIAHISYMVNLNLAVFRTQFFIDYIS